MVKEAREKIRKPKIPEGKKNTHLGFGKHERLKMIGKGKTLYFFKKGEG